MSKGVLYLIPSFLSETSFENVFPEFNKNVILKLDEFIVEELKTARRFLRKIGYKKYFDEVEFHVLNEHTEETEVEGFLNSLMTGENVGLLSEAGIPCIADPGAEVVRIAQQVNVKVVPLVGPSSIFLALMASGFNGQNFIFHGYLPVDKRERKRKLLELEQNSGRSDQTQIFIETPYRNNQMFQSIIKVCNPETLLCTATNITGSDERIVTKTVKDWRKTNLNIHKQPTVFLIYH